MKFIKDYKITGIVILLILVAILMPGSSVPKVGVPGIDKVVHLGMFFTLTATFNVEYLWHNKYLPHVLLTFMSIFIFAVSTEVIQLFASNRSCDLKDLLADMIGAVIAIFIIKGIAYLHNKKRT